MSKKSKTPEVNAGSMADIAFLLLIFFLVTTTMEKEQGIKKTLPQKVESEDKITILNRNLLDIQVNKNDELLVEGVRSDVDKLYGIAKDFLVNEENLEKYPQFKLVDRSMAEKQIAKYEKLYEDAEQGSTERIAIKEKLEKWKDKLAAVKALGEPYREIHKTAIMTIDMDEESSYGRYIEILSELQAAQSNLRDEVSMENFGVKFDELDERDDADKILAVRKIIPQRIIKKEK